MSDAPTIVLMGATGLIGRWLVHHSFPRSLTLLSRRAPDHKPRAGLQTKVAGTDQWPRNLARLAPDILICCIGTTMRAVGGQAEAFRHVDQHLPIACAAAARGAGSRHMMIVTSVGASTRVDNVYLNAKGKVEDALIQLDFPRLDIIRPGLLIGPRKELRPMEVVGQRLAPWLDPLLRGSLRKYRSIGAETVAKAIWALADAGGTGTHVHDHDAIVALAR